MIFQLIFYGSIGFSGYALYRLIQSRKKGLVLTFLSLGLWLLIFSHQLIQVAHDDNPTNLVPFFTFLKVRGLI